MVRPVPDPFAAFDAHVRARRQEFLDELGALVAAFRHHAS